MKPNQLTSVTVIGVLLFAGAMTLQADDWPQFRGPNRDGVSAEKGLLQKWPDGGPPKAWTASGLGGRYGSVAVVNGTVYTIGNRRGKSTLWALDDATGKPKWSTPIVEQGAGGGNSTPTVANGKVYALSEKGDLLCADAAYESTDGGATWTKAVDKPKGGAVFMWSYDPVGDVFYAQTGSIFRYAR